MIFAREISAPLTSLVKKIDAATAENAGAKMGSFVVFLGDEAELKKQVKELGDQESIKDCVLATMSTPAGPAKYQVAKAAAVTVVLYNKSKVEANYTFENGKLTDKDVEKIIGDLRKILPKK